MGNRDHYLWDRAHLGHIIVQQQQAAEAREIFLQTSEEFLKTGNIVGVCYSLEGIAALFVKTDRSVVAARLIGFADATREKINDLRPRLEQEAVDKIIVACIAEIGKVDFSDAYHEGKAMTLDEAVAYALG